MTSPRGNTLGSPAVAAVLARLRAEGAARDAPGKRRVADREAQLGTEVYGLERAELYGDAPLAVTAEVGELLWLLALARRPGLIVEFGGSVGVSTIYLAAALRDLGAGRLISTELVPRKAQLAEANLTEAGLSDLVEVRAGDAQRTLVELPAAVDLLFLDGSNDLYLPILGLVGARLAPGALVVADLSVGDPHHDRYVAHVRDPANGYLSARIALDAGVVVSAAVGAPSRPDA